MVPKKEKYKIKITKSSPKYQETMCSSNPKTMFMLGLVVIIRNMQPDFNNYGLLLIISDEEATWWYLYKHSRDCKL